MTIADKREYTIGIEEEYQLVDSTSGELKSRARGMLAWDWTGEFKAEMHQNTLEVGTRVCVDSQEAKDELKRLRMQAAVAAEAQGCQLVAAGLHPFSHWRGQAYTEKPVYERIRREYRRIADTQMIYGMHVHIGVPERVDRVRIMNVARLYLPYVLALTASSPFYMGSDTGYCSYRSVLWSRWPRSGAPPRFADRAEFDGMVEKLLATGRIDSPARIYWTMRPHHVYPTLEFRVADATPRLDDAVAAAALARIVVAAVADGVLREPEQPAPVLGVFLEENLWRAARDGVDAEIVQLDEGRPRALTVVQGLAELSERLGPVASALGEEAALASLGDLARRGDAASRIRERWQTAEPRAVVQWMADETVLGLGLDRRAEQRA
jgi:glutamate---cysteine ligase / carboxylate-amine ligase